MTLTILKFLGIFYFFKQKCFCFKALSWAVQRNQKAVIKLLLAKGADPHKKHRDNLTAIDLADGKDDVS